jgi:transposase
LRSIGEDVSEVLDFVPQHWKVIRHVRPKCACDQCQKIVQAAAPSRPIARGMAGTGLLAHVLVSKYADCLPLYRQSEIYARDGVEIERSTLADWVGSSAALLAPLVERIGLHTLSGSKLHADDTPVPVLAPGLGKAKTGRLWTYVRDDRPAGSDIPPAVFFRYTPDRKGEHPREHLKNFRGTLQTDGYAGFHHLYDTGKIFEAACWAHVRKKFFDIHAANAPPIALEALSRIGALYGIEQEIRGKPAEDRQAQRQARAAPFLADLKDWLLRTAATLSAKSELAFAIRYATARWPALTRYRDDGNVEIVNNAAERSLRVVANGRKNFLFCGSDAGGHRAAAIYSLIGAAKLNGINPETYLRFVLERIAEHPSNKLDELLPWNVAALIEAHDHATPEDN